jgi:hypothetical protein
VEEQHDGNRDEEILSNKQAKKMSRADSDREAKVDAEALRRRVRGMTVQPEVDEDSGEEFAQQIEAQLLAEASDDEMQDVGTKVKTEQDLADEAWAAFDAAVVEGPTAIANPKPRAVEDKLRMPVSTIRKRGIEEDLGY